MYIFNINRYHQIGFCRDYTYLIFPTVYWSACFSIVFTNMLLYTELIISATLALIKAQQNVHSGIFSLLL